jgi:hypothetical protein
MVGKKIVCGRLVHQDRDNSRQQFTERQLDRTEPELPIPP